MFGTLSSTTERARRGGNRSLTRRSGLRVGIAACLVAGAAAGPAFADPGNSAGTVRWDGGTVVLGQVEDVDPSGLTFVGTAADFSSVDPSKTCLNGEALYVYTSQITDRLLFTNRASAVDMSDLSCPVAWFQALIGKPLPVPGSVAPCITQACISDQAVFRLGQASQAAFFQVEAGLGLALSAPNHATGAVASTKAGSLAEALAGKMMSQVESLTGLYAMQFSASLTNLETNLHMTLAGQHVGVGSPLRIDPSNAVGCLMDGCPVLDVLSPRGAQRSHGGSHQDPAIEPKRFVYNNGITPTYTKKSENKGVYGAVIYNIWATNEKVSNEHDFWATSQDASVTPAKSSRLTRNYTALSSESDGIRMIESAPNQVTHQGQGETVTINATLNGNVSAKKDGTGGEIGMNFGVSRSYTKPDSNTGGAALSATGHYALWETGDNGSGFAKLASGVETWAIPTNAPVGWLWAANASYCNDPCGP